MSSIIMIGQSKSLPRRSSKYFLSMICALVALSLTAFTQAQILNWTTPVNDNYKSIGGTTGRQGVGAVMFNGSLWIAYTRYVSSGESQVLVASNPNGSTIWGNPVQVNPAYPDSIVTHNNPSLAVDPYTNTLYLAVTNDFGNNYQYSTGAIFTSTDGVNWSGEIGGCDNFVTGSPYVTYFNGFIYLAQENTDTSLNICQIGVGPNSGIRTNQSFPGVNMGFVAGLGVWTPPGGSPTLYVGYQDFNSHNIELLLSTDGTNFGPNPVAPGDQTSTTPSFGTYNGVLYMGFRANDGGHAFLYKYTTDGVNWSGSVNVGPGMSGPPMFVDTTQNGGWPQSPYNGQLYNIFGTDYRTLGLFSMHTQ